MNIATLIIEIFFLLLLLFQIICLLYCLLYKIGKKRGFMESLEENQIIDVVLDKTMREILTDEQIEKFSARLGANFQSKITEIQFNKNKEENEDERN